MQSAIETVFPREWLDKQPWKEPVWVGEISDSPSIMIEPRRASRLTSESPLHIWELPIAAAKYTIAIDPSSGNKKGDPAAIQIVGDWGHQIAEVLMEGIAPIGQMQTAMWLGRLYNNALLVIESNGFGIECVRYAEEMKYPNLYWQRKGTYYDNGFVTTMRTKEVIIESMKMGLQMREPFLHSFRLREELQVFGQSRDNSNDLAMAMLIAHGVRGKGMWKL
jgi:hypothetical protein